MDDFKSDIMGGGLTLDLRTASFTVGVLGPGAVTAVGVEDQITGAGEVALLSVDAREHHIADG